MSVRQLGVHTCLWKQPVLHFWLGSCWDWLCTVKAQPPLSASIAPAWAYQTPVLQQHPAWMLFLSFSSKKACIGHCWTLWHSISCQALSCRWDCWRSAWWTCWIETDELILFKFPFLQDASVLDCAFRSVTLVGAGHSLLQNRHYQPSVKMVAFNLKVRMFHGHIRVNFWSLKEMGLRCGWVSLVLKLFPLSRWWLHYHTVPQAQRACRLRLCTLNLSSGFPLSRLFSGYSLLSTFPYQSVVSLLYLLGSEGHKHKGTYVRLRNVGALFTTSYNLFS